MSGILVCRTPEDALVQLNIALLKQQHAEILSAVAELTKLFVGSFEEAGPQLGPARTTLARLIATHLRTEEEELHVPLRARGLTVSIGVQKGPPIGVQKGPPSSSSVTGMTGAPFALVAA
jgi:hypothetical protein